MFLQSAPGPFPGCLGLLVAQRGVTVAATRTTEQIETVPFDAHGIDPIPPHSRDSTPWEQFWIWAEANIAPINWVLGALGITLGLSLADVVLVLVVGNLIGMGLFGFFVLMGQRTG